MQKYNTKYLHICIIYKNIKNKCNKYWIFVLSVLLVVPYGTMNNKCHCIGKVSFEDVINTYTNYSNM